MTAARRASKHRNWKESPGNSRSNASQPQQRPIAQSADWQRSYEHYRTLAESSMGADPITSEQYWQHAEHFRRLINEAASQLA